MISSKKVYYKELDLIRVFLCISVFLYHLGILKGGYMAVCAFFVLSGYLSVLSAFRKEKFSFKEYYKKRFMHIYLPLLVVVFISIFSISLISSINWINLKPETTSVLFGYNNYWQLGANLDYFTRNVSSPFTHFWYISILLQFELVFPFIFLLFKSIKEKLNKHVITCILLILLFISIGYFSYVSTNKNIMFTYYDTFTRLFSIIFGLTLGYIKHYYNSLTSTDNQKQNKVIIYSYLVLLLLMFIFIDSSSILFTSTMIVSSLIAFRLIDYATQTSDEKPNKCIKFISDISYEIYLVQYPVIFLFQLFNINNYIKIPLIIIITIFISYIIHLCLNIKKENKKIIKILQILLIIILLFGIFKYITSKDHTKEMKDLENQLVQNESKMKEKQEEYLAKLKEEEDSWNQVLESMEKGEETLKEVVKNLPIVGIGDSVMLGAVNQLYEQFPNGYFDAAVSRTDYELSPILNELNNKGMLGDIIVLNLGTNGECPQSCKDYYLSIIGNREIFWVNATRPDYPIFNTRLINLASAKENVHIVDWISASAGHPEYFVADGIHLTSSGRVAYTKAVYDTIYNYYLDKYNKEKEEKLKKHEEELKTKITFYGNDLLLNAFNYIQGYFGDAKYEIDNYTFESLINKLENESLTYKLVFAFDSTLNLSIDQYNTLFKLCEGHDIYIITMKDINIEKENVKIINFIKESEKDYLMVDKIHLTEEGNIFLSELLNKYIYGK